ncbi:MAG: OmpA family protein [Bacteroidia bacterium]|nr:OmpA family protein [Bacteroidia bacterium]MDW8089046.1 OmpA family protein [Bacteroidia bacterium]
MIDAHGDEAYIVLENRPDGLGKDDIYCFRVWPELHPEGIASYVRGRVIEAQSGAAVTARVYALDPQTRDTLRALSANFATGEFLLSLPLGQSYLFFAEAEGYLPYSEFLDLSQKDTAYVLEIPLRRIDKGASITLRNVFFDFDKATLRPESEVELRKVAEILRQNPSWRIEVQGHTDSVGHPAYNQNLSQRRAEAVRQFLIDQGIAARRITARGYGATRPIAPNTTEDGRARNRRVEILFLSKE